MHRFRDVFCLTSALLVSVSSPGFAKGGGGGGGGGGHSSGGGHFSGGSHMSTGHSMGASSFHEGGAHMPTSGEMGHLTGEHSNPLWSPYFSSETKADMVEHHGFGHGLGKLFGRSSAPKLPAGVTAPGGAPQGEQMQLQSSPTALLGGGQVVPNLGANNSLNPYFHSYNPFFNNGYYRQQPYFPGWNPYHNNYWNNGYNNPYSPWMYQGYNSPLLYSYSNPFYYSSFYPAYSLPYANQYSYTSAAEPYFVQPDGSGPNVISNYSDPNGDNWNPPTYDPNSGIADPNLVPFDMTAKGDVPAYGSPAIANPGGTLPSGWTP
jgi:hypothetical protein